MAAAADDTVQLVPLAHQSVRFPVSRVVDDGNTRVGVVEARDGRIVRVSEHVDPAVLPEAFGGTVGAASHPGERS